MAANTKKPPTKSEIYAKIVDDTGLTRKDVAAVFDSLNGQIKKNLGGRGAPGMFTIPGLLKLFLKARLVGQSGGRRAEITKQRPAAVCRLDDQHGLVNRVAHRPSEPEFGPEALLAAVPDLQLAMALQKINEHVVAHEVIALAVVQVGKLLFRAFRLDLVVERDQRRFALHVGLSGQDIDL